MKIGANQMENKKICIIGGGWLGKSLASTLSSNGFDLTLTGKSDKGPDFLSYPYIQLELNSSFRSEIPRQILDADVLIYAIFPLEFSIIQPFFEQLPAYKKIIFTSSTSVYGKNSGEVFEDFPLNQLHSNSPLLVQTENYLQKKFKMLTIIRPGGLYGKDRHPIFFLQGKKGLTNGHEFLHLVHQEDCINAILAIIKKNLWNHIFNLVSDLRIEKNIYYTEMAKRLNFLPPEYSLSKESKSTLNSLTKISNSKSKKLLNLNYLDPMTFFPSK